MLARLVRPSLALAALLLARGAPAQAQSGRWRPDDRVLITAFDQVGALASDARTLFVATRGGLLSYDFLRAGWLLPSTQVDGYPINESPTALAVDGVQRDVWLGTASGGLFRWRGLPPRWETVGFALGSEVLSIVPSIGAEEEGIWVQTRTAWFRAGRLSMGVTPAARVPAAILQRAAALRTLDPALAAFRSTLGLDEHSRRWPITSFARGERPEQYWFGTAGAFLIRFDALRGQPEWFWYGAPARGVSALALVADTLWLGSDGRGPRNGVVRVTGDLQNWRLFDPLSGGPSGRIEQIVATDTHLYFAGSDGVLRVDRRSARAERLSSARASTVAVAGQHVWIGTRAGLLHIADQARRPTLGAQVNRVRVLGERVWLASGDGVYHAAVDAHPDSLRLVREEGLPSAQFLDVARASDRVFAITAAALFVQEGTSWRGPVRLPVSGGLGRLTTLAGDGAALWIGGVNGLARYQPGTEEWLYFLVPRDLPAGPIDIAPAREAVWLATPAGALRLNWRRP